MEDNSAKAASMVRVLAIVHIIVGFLLFFFGIADVAVSYFWTVIGGFGIWIGVWMIIAGGLGIRGTRKERCTPRNAFVTGIFMGFSIVSAVLGRIIIICYSISIDIHRDDYRHDFRYGYGAGQKYRRNIHDTAMALSAVILILGVVEFVIGIWASVCLCLMKPCKCCCNTPLQQQQVMYTANTGYVLTQGPGSAPVAIPMQTAGGMVAVQTVTPGAQGGQPQIVMVPVSASGVYQSQLAPYAPAGATGYQPQQAEMPPPYGQEQYMTQRNAQVPVKI
ncbi:uncharacterized protein LOC144665439 [Oculina patagonica]